MVKKRMTGYLAGNGSMEWPGCRTMAARGTAAVQTYAACYRRRPGGVERVSLQAPVCFNSQTTEMFRVGTASTRIDRDQDAQFAQLRGATNEPLAAIIKRLFTASPHASRGSRYHHTPVPR